MTVVASKERSREAMRLLLPERFRCGAEQRAQRFRVDLEYEDIGEDLLELRKKAYDLCEHFVA